MDFIESISHSTGKNTKTWTGERDMIDLQKTVVNYYYDPVTGGSNSIKDILPAVLHSSTYQLLLALGHFLFGVSRKSASAM